MKEVGIKASRRRVRPGNGILFAATIILAVLFLAPVFFAIISAFKSNGEILKNPMSLPTTLYLKNFQDLFAQSDFVTAIFHSVVLTLVSEVLIVFIVPMAAYAMERRRTRTTIFIYTYFLAGMMIPFHLYMFPLFKEMKMFGLFGNLAGPIACYISGSVAFGSLLYCSFLKGVPLEIEEAAQIDGCNPFQTFWKVTFPLLGPCTASMVVLNGLGIWNDFLMPYLVLPSDRAKTITVEVYSFVGQYTARWDIVFAGTVCSIIPALIIFVLLQKYFVKGITAGAARQEKRADRANYGRNPEGFFLRVRLKAGFEACFHHPFFLPSCLSSCVPRKRKLLNLLLLPSPGAPQALGLLYWLREVRRAEDGVEIEVKWDVWYNGG